MTRTLPDLITTMKVNRLIRKDEVMHIYIFIDGLERKDEVMHIYIFIDGLERKDEVMHIYYIKLKL